MTAETDKDAGFTARALGALPPVAVSPAFRDALLAGYDAYQARRPSGLAAAVTAAFSRFSEMVWPGAPAWAPGAALAAALVVGIGVGVALPSPASEERGGFSLDEPLAFTLAGLDLTESL